MKLVPETHKIYWRSKAQDQKREITRLTARVEELEAIVYSVAAIDLDSGTEHDEALMMLAIEQARAAISKGESRD